ncbi:MAG: FIST C-terminal domain-containing protein [Treponema sp.]|nr:FIST C-terminal domain-containing protein [Treponema sp.]
MIKMLTAHTEEVDDVDAAVQEILDKLDLDSRLLKHSIGLIHCYPEFLESGIVRELASKVPFDVAGITTVSLSIPGFISEFGLTVSVLTSDDVEFAADMSSPVGEDPSVPFKELYGRLVKKLSKKPSLLLSFFPFVQHIGGDELAAGVDAVSGGLPQFGTLSISDDIGFNLCATIYNDKSEHSSAVLVALAGEVKPEFLTISVDDEISSPEKAVITQANRNLLQCINNMPATKYMESIGLVSGADTKWTDLPVIIYPEDGTRLIRATVDTGAGDSLVLAGAAPVNSRIVFSSIDADKVKLSAETVFKQALAAAKSGGESRSVLVYSCVSRFWALGIDEMAEHEIAKKIFGDSVPYHLVYSGGEILPSILPNGAVINHQQNYSVIICVL